jgi:hypothetical protein
MGGCVFIDTCVHCSPFPEIETTRKRRNLLLKLLQLPHIKCLVPTDIYQHFDAPIELQQGLRCARFGLRSLQRGKGKHLAQLVLVDQHIW